MQKKSALTQKQKIQLVWFGIAVSALFVILGIVFSIIAAIFNWGSYVFVTWIMIELIALIIFVWLIYSLSKAMIKNNPFETEDDWLEEAKNKSDTK